ncbi:hypothetical protein P4H27_26070 [Paenibacillus taichungensis]|uniref:hypothetical protein n=1 Tax=Paenibacillus taichungensis TaxID=484184 RepID=UPI002DBE27F1|nr:hypothetical protein [Paenibacillus taichungensis]MEC0110441.1 hypothetical protein [Paenibacillus taichungensis]MEC0200117.1 hypothetical protein [Paenibacillus taichungensis]
MDYTKLTEDLKASHKAVQEAVVGTKDGGTANLDKVFMTLPRAREAKVLEAIRDAGLYCRAKRRWIGEGYMITVNGAQANVRERSVTLFVAEMERRGYQVLAYRQMD